MNRAISMIKAVPPTFMFFTWRCSEKTQIWPVLYYMIVIQYLNTGPVSKWWSKNRTVQQSNNFWPFEYQTSPIFRSPLYRTPKIWIYLNTWLFGVRCSNGHASWLSKTIPFRTGFPMASKNRMLTKLVKTRPGSTTKQGCLSSLNCNIWCSFCSFFYGWMYSDHRAFFVTS